MKLNRIEEQIKMLISDISMFPEDEILVDDKLIDLGIDTSKVAEFAAKAEEFFGIGFDKFELNILMTVNQLIELLESYV